MNLLTKLKRKGIATKTDKTPCWYCKHAVPARNKDGEYRITKPDTDNLQKLLKDCMTLVGFWKDDALVASEICEKFWAETSGVYVRVEEL